MLANGKVILLIPAYQPDETLTEVVSKTLKLAKDELFEFECIIINDGSNTVVAKDTFDKLHHLDCVSVISHKENQGKGAALKTGIRNILGTYPETSVVVTADADGQHLPKDIINVAWNSLFNETNSLGVREFDKDVPLRSRLGNIVTRWVFRLLHGTHIVDTQTGLRAITNTDLESLLDIKHDGYDYELEMLVKMVENKPLHQIPIATVYESGNPTSHFNPIMDSLKIYAVLLRHTVVTLLVACIDFMIFIAMTKLDQPVALSLIVSRAVSTAILFSLAREFVFRSSENIFIQLLKFFALVAVNIVFLWAFIQSMVNQFGFNRITAMVVGYLIFFFGNFLVQRYYIFGQRKKVDI